jgi:phosphotransferase system enzyme I (PtsP)
MGPASIGPIKEMVLHVNLKPIQESVAAALSLGADGVAIRELLREWVAKQNLPMG